jgi:hypothetical protein
MNQEVWKFCTTDRGFVGRFEIKMPINTQLLYVDIDANNFPCIWGLVYPLEEEYENRYFELFGTGHPIPNDMGVERKYVGSYRYQNGEFIGHIFERIN